MRIGLILGALGRYSRCLAPTCHVDGIRMKTTISNDMKKYKPTTPGRRWLRRPVNNHLWKGGPVRKLTSAKRKQGGRNNTGRVTVRHQGGGHRRRIRHVDFHRLAPGPHEVERIEYDPGRSGHIALIRRLADQSQHYILAPLGIRQGDILESYRAGIPQQLLDEMGMKADKVDPGMLAARTVSNGNCLPLRMIPVGAIVHALAISPNGPAKLCRSAGTFARIVSRTTDGKYAVIRLQSGETRKIHIDAGATMGVVSNKNHQHRKLGKAGRSRWLGIRPTVRGVAMNAVDHPHGGGRGKSKGNVLSSSPWGQLAKGKKTRIGKNKNRMRVKDRPRGKRS